jgi:hypothetical protein
MSVWGPVFHEVELDMDLGELRVDAVTKTIELMQQKGPVPLCQGIGIDAVSSS